MDKSHKIAIIIILSVLTGCILITFLVKTISNVTVLNLITPDKFTNIKNVHISGREEKNRHWEITADECWSGMDRNRTIFENVSSCLLFENDSPIVKDLTARRVIVDGRTKDIEVFKNVDNKGWLKAKIDFNRTDNKSEYSTVFADYIRFNPNTEKGQIKDNIIIIKNDLTIEAKEIFLDLDKNIAEINGSSTYKKGDNIITGTSATAALDKDTINISNIEVYQTNKTAVAGHGIMDDRKKTLTLNKDVQAVIEKTANELRETSVQKLRSSETKDALREKTVINCDSLTLNMDDNNFSANGNVLVTQKEKKAKADHAEYSENSEDIILNGNVFMEKKNQWIKTKKIIVSVKNETFHAIGDVETEFVIKK